MGCGNLVLSAYGVDRFIEDVDRDRQFFRDGAVWGDTNIIASVLAWMAGRGFTILAEDNDWTWKSAAEFRHRHVALAVARAIEGG